MRSWWGELVRKAVELRRRVSLTGYDVAAGDTWAINELVLPFERRPMVFERPLCVALDGFPPSGITKRVTFTPRREPAGRTRPAGRRC